MTHINARMTVDLAALKTNYRVLKSLRQGTEIAGVVKADAYGLGVARVAPALAEAGCKTFFTAQTQEAVALATILRDHTARICVLNGPAADEIDAYHKHKFIPVLNTPDQIALWQWQGKDAPCMLHVDTGMNRLGLGAADVQALVSTEALRENLNVIYILSHFANGATPDSQMNPQQIRSFARTMETLTPLFPKAQESLSASAGLFLEMPITEDLARPGISLYGIGPRDTAEPLLQTVATLEAPILQLRNVPAGEPVGYGGTFTTTRESRIATIGIGYGDGFARSFGNKGHIWVKNTLCPIVGAVSMDLTTIDVTGCPNELAVGEMVEIFGYHRAVEDLAREGGTIAYELIVTLGERVERVYTEE